MKRVCAWCNKTMSPAKGGVKTSTSMVTHSICSDCADNLDFQLGVSLKTYLNSLKMPIVALDGSGSLIGINSAAMEAYKGKAVVDTEKWSENVYECSHARLPERCKSSVHCSGCAIRIVVTECFATGKAVHNLPAHLNHCSSDFNEKTELLISADKIDNIIFLRIVRL